MRTRHGTRASMQRWSGGSRDRDRGQTFVEILVSIVLLGTAVGGTLTALRTTIVSGEADNGHAQARAWLATAQDAVYRATYEPCSVGVVQVTTAYDDAVRAAVQAVLPPEGWAGGSAGVNAVSFWSKSDGTEIWGAACGTEVSAQLVEIYVLIPGGAVGKTIQVIKSGG